MSQEHEKTVAINWNKLDKFTALPYEISSICMYAGKKLSAEHKNLYCYLAKLQADGKLNGNGFASYETIMQRFGIGSHKTLTKYLDHFVNVGLLIKEEQDGSCNTYEVKPLKQHLVSYPAKSHTADSNKARREKQKEQVSEVKDKPKKVDNYPIIVKQRKLYEDNPEKLKAWNKYAIKFDKANREITKQDVVDFTSSYQETLEPATAKPEPFVFTSKQWVFTPSTSDHVDRNLDVWGEEEEGLEQCAEDFVLHDAELTNESDFNSDRVTDGDKDKLLPLFADSVSLDVDGKGVGWFAGALVNAPLSINETKQYLKTLRDHYWDEYNPDQKAVDTLHKKLSCPYCGKAVNDADYCTDTDCKNSEDEFPF